MHVSLPVSYRVKFCGGIELVAKTGTELEQFSVDIIGTNQDPDSGTGKTTTATSYTTGKRFLLYSQRVPTLVY